LSCRNPSAETLACFLKSLTDPDEAELFAAKDFIDWKAVIDFFTGEINSFENDRKSPKFSATNH
jgi:hypothetical protein